jgi:hypothetical protein
MGLGKSGDRSEAMSERSCKMPDVNGVGEDGAAAVWAISTGGIVKSKVELMVKMLPAKPIAISCLWYSITILS